MVKLFEGIVSSSRCQAEVRVPGFRPRQCSQPLYKYVGKVKLCKEHARQGEGKQ
jgi:hypothetical protein